MPTVLITGSNRGLGLEFARQYAGDGWRVIACCRHPDQANELKGLAETCQGAVELRALEVAEAGSVAALAEALAGRPIDLLVNNAGVGQRGGDTLGSIDYAFWQEAFATNTLGPMWITEALLENLAAGEQKRVVTVSSGLGSLGLLAREGGSITGASLAAYQYRTTKAAVNMAMLTLAHQLRSRGITVALLSPGWVRTDMGGPNAPLSPEASIAGMRRVIAGLTLERTGRFLSYDGADVPW